MEIILLEKNILLISFVFRFDVKNKHACYFYCWSEWVYAEIISLCSNM